MIIVYVFLSLDARNYCCCEYIKKTTQEDTDNSQTMLSMLDFSQRHTIEQYIVFVGARYKHVSCTNSKLRGLYSLNPPAK